MNSKARRHVEKDVEKKYFYPEIENPAGFERCVKVPEGNGLGVCLKVSAQVI